MWGTTDASIAQFFPLTTTLLSNPPRSRPKSPSRPTPFPLRWGGGSLHHLKARLATLGCIADLVWAYDETRAQWRPYSQYRTPASLNQPFHDDFREHLPAGDLYATCFDPCEFRYFDDPPDADIRCNAHPTDLSQLERADWSGGVTFGFGEPCTDDWHPTVAERILPDLRSPAGGA